MAATDVIFGSSYHVFLSFRGEDTRKSFADHLYTALDNAGIRTFRDNQIERGENIMFELEKVIEQSRCSIIVFSKDYALSKNCLDEVVLILKWRETSGHVVLPVFYEVNTTDVKNQTGSFSEAFAAHEERFKGNTAGMDRVKGWRAALEEVANFAGMELKNDADGHEAEFIKKIVEVIKDKLSWAALHTEPYLIGMHSRVKNINSWVQDGSSNAGIVVISGIRGIGKTTIAKSVYNSNFRRFKHSSFLAVREFAELPYGLVELQKKLISDLLNQNTTEKWSIDEGIIKVKEAIASKKALIVFDDVYEEEQVFALVGMRDWFFPGSKIIITTRDELLLKAYEICMMYKVEELNYDESLKLFSLHAFGQDYPIESYKDATKRIVNCCAGLPLALKVLGSSLSGKSVDLWKSKADRLEEIPSLFGDSDETTVEEKYIKTIEIGRNGLQPPNRIRNVLSRASVTFQRKRLPKSEQKVIGFSYISEHVKKMSTCSKSSSTALWGGRFSDLKPKTHCSVVTMKTKQSHNRPIPHWISMRTYTPSGPMQIPGICALRI